MKGAKSTVAGDCAAASPSAAAGECPSRGIALRALALRGWRGELAATLCFLPMLLVAAVWNGFPLIYYDTGAYIFEGLGGHFMVERSPIYSLFVRFAGGGTSLWFVAGLQAAASAFVIVQTARAIAPRATVGNIVVIGAALVIATGLPWYVGQIEPDCFTAPVVLCVYLLAFRLRELGWLRAAGIAAVGAFAAAAHPSHLVLSGLLSAALVATRSALWLCKGSPLWPRPGIAGPALVCVVGIALTTAANFEYTGEIFVSRAGVSFVFARMLQDGIVMRLLDDRCPQAGYRLCAWRDSLPATADGWLWTPGSPFFKLGHFRGTAAESQRIVADAILRYPVLQLEKAAADAATQFARFGTGDQIEPQEWVLAPVLGRYVPRQMGAYLAARQQKGRIDFRAISFFDVVVGWLSLGALAVVLGIAIRRRLRDEAVFLGFVLVALIANALVCGVLSGPHDRYQSRLIWIIPFAILLVVPFGRTGFTLRGFRESVT